ncbi:MAG TPA: alpha/beta hydrolase [Candidatus Dormibacteraeota bacterium]|nr:alpha/beta hydrolase [Candidatus Dormibacteraeota bacterium]
MPSTTPSATQPHRRLRRILIALTLVTILPAAAGALYQSLSEGRDRRAHPMPGQLIDVGGYRMHINCMGQGTPTVILDSGLGDSYLSWSKVQSQIAQFTRVCSYDRAGLGYSDSSPRSRTSKDFAEELHTLLHKASVPSPYVLVGHSLGGFDVRLYASLYRNEVAGMVLVDSSHPEQQKRLPAALTDLDTRTVREQESLEFTIPFGIPRLLGFCGDDAEVRAAECNFHSVREGVAELKAVSESAQQTAAAGTLGDLPLIVLSSDPDKPQPDLPADLVKPTNDAWEKMQEELPHLSTRGTQVIAKNSGHYIQLDRPDLVVEAVRQVVDHAHQAQAAAEPSR